MLNIKKEKMANYTQDECDYFNVQRKNQPERSDWLDGAGYLGFENIKMKNKLIAQREGLLNKLITMRKSFNGDLLAMLSCSKIKSLETRIRNVERRIEIKR